MNGIEPYEYMTQLSMNLAAMDNLQEVEAALDRLEYLFEVMPPELLDLAEELIDQVRKKLEQFR